MKSRIGATVYYESGREIKSSVVKSVIELEDKYGRKLRGLVTLENGHQFFDDGRECYDFSHVSATDCIASAPAGMAITCPVCKEPVDWVRQATEIERFGLLMGDTQSFKCEKCEVSRLFSIDIVVNHKVAAL